VADGSFEEIERLVARRHELHMYDTADIFEEVDRKRMRRGKVTLGNDVRYVT